jgi:hypothetical protein
MGLQLLTDTHLEHANDRSDWVIDSLGGGRHLVRPPTLRSRQSRTRKVSWVTRGGDYGCSALEMLGHNQPRDSHFTGTVPAPLRAFRVPKRAATQGYLRPHAVSALRTINGLTRSIRRIELVRGPPNDSQYPRPQG